MLVVDDVVAELDALLAVVLHLLALVRPSNCRRHAADAKDVAAPPSACKLSKHLD